LISIKAGIACAAKSLPGVAKVNSGQFLGIFGAFTPKRDALAGKDGKLGTIFRASGMVHKGRVAEAVQVENDGL
jgi:hypothetical protein